MEFLRSESAPFMALSSPGLDSMRLLQEERKFLVAGIF